MPPPRLKPTTPTSVAEPHSGASPCGWAATTTVLHLVPGSTVAVELCGSMYTPVMREVSMSRVSAVAGSSAPWPVAWTLTLSPRAAA